MERKRYREVARKIEDEEREKMEEEEMEGRNGKIREEQGKLEEKKSKNSNTQVDPAKALNCCHNGS